RPLHRQRTGNGRPRRQGSRAQARPRRAHPQGDPAQHQGRGWTTDVRRFRPARVRSGPVGEEVGGRWPGARGSADEGGTMRFWRDPSSQNKVLVIFLPLLIVPMLILATVGFVTSSREAAKTASRYLSQRETDLRTIAENPAIPSYFNNKSYGLTEEAEVARRE